MRPRATALRAARGVRRGHGRRKGFGRGLDHGVPRVEDGPPRPERRRRAQEGLVGRRAVEVVAVAGDGRPRAAPDLSGGVLRRLRVEDARRLALEPREEALRRPRVPPPRLQAAGASEGTASAAGAAVDAARLPCAALPRRRPLQGRHAPRQRRRQIPRPLHLQGPCGGPRLTLRLRPLPPPRRRLRQRRTGLSQARRLRHPGRRRHGHPPLLRQLRPGRPGKPLLPHRPPELPQTLGQPRRPHARPRPPDPPQKFLPRTDRDCPQ
mmetsp:Transcript_13320/g.43422  ORF Transcript_13320/g.43422 Transcript_13320/m.43422 type:complete len:266 (+) Transcript_13320:182-979(+)